MMGKGVSIEGMEGLKKKLNQLPATVVDKADEVMFKVGSAYVDRAVNGAPEDRGQIAETISIEKKAVMDYKIVSPAPHSVWMEFGTKGRYQAIPGIDASQYKGKGQGDYYDFLNAILDWVKRKGIASRFSIKTRKPLAHTKDDNARMVETAQAIANSIIRHGIHPHPFFFKQLPIAAEEMEKLLPEGIRVALNK